ncbi:MAG TPA: alpha/beta hydrolase [Streptosporangiaceae bacterium]
MAQPEYAPELARLAVPGAGVLVRYGDHADQFGELWPAAAADTAGPRPVAVLVHGGFWRARYRLDLMNALAAHLSATGVAVWNIEYRRADSGGGGWPGTFDDVAAAFGALPLLAAEHGLDLGRVAVIGHSAGGHLALWLAADAARAARAGGTPAPPVGIGLVVGLAPVGDLVEAHRRGLARDAAGRLLGAAYADAPERYLAASPAALLPLGVPQLIVHGTADEAVPYDMSVDFQAAARAAGDACELLSLPGTGHFELIDPGSAAWLRVTPYLSEVLGRPNPS